MKLRRIVHRKASQNNTYLGGGTGWGRARVVRGGSWYNGYASDLRADDGGDGGPSYQYNDIGARLFRRIKTKKRQ